MTHCIQEERFRQVCVALAQDICQRITSIEKADNLDIWFERGNTEAKQADMLYLTYMVQIRHENGRDAELAESVPVICMPHNIDPAIMADMIDQRVRSVRSLLK